LHRRVPAPFYRLISDSDGTAECQNASFDELLSDVEDAFTWVQQNSETFGAEGKPVVFGQSAGGHLAAYLAVQQPSEVERAVLFYAPTDFTDFGGQIVRGEYTNEAGITILQEAVGVESGEIDLQSPLFVENTFPAVVAEQPAIYPPMFMLHGESDSLLPSRQSVRMCNGLAGDVENGPVPFDINTDSIARSFACAAEAIESMLAWVSVDTLAAFSNVESTSGGGGSMGLMLFLLLLKARCRRLRESVL